MTTPGRTTDDFHNLMVYEANRKSVGLAFLLWFFLGVFGGHRFYLERAASAVVMLIITIVSWLLVFVGVGVIGILVIAIWALVDAFRIPGWVRAINTNALDSLRDSSGIVEHV
jgi:TM2 domain-containing membrane protein YozV